MVSLEGSLDRAVRTLFCLLSNNHGVVSLATVQEMMKARSANFQIPQGLSDEHVRLAFQRLDLKKTNEVTYDDFKSVFIKWLHESGFDSKVKSIERFHRGILTKSEMECMNRLVLLYFFSSACDTPIYLSQIKTDFLDGMLDSSNTTSQGLPFKSEPNTLQDRDLCFKQIDIEDISSIVEQLRAKNLSTYQNALDRLNGTLVWTDFIHEQTMRYQFLEETARVLTSLWKEDIFSSMVSRILKDFSPHIEIINHTFLFLTRVADYVNCCFQYAQITLQGANDPEVQFAKLLRAFLCSKEVVMDLVEAVATLDTLRFKLCAVYIGKLTSFAFFEPAELTSLEVPRFLAHGFFQAEVTEWVCIVPGILGLIKNYSSQIKTELVTVNGHLHLPLQDALCDDLVGRITGTSEVIHSIQIVRVLLEHCSSQTCQTLADKLPARLYQLFLEETNINLRHIVFNIFKKFLPLGHSLSAQGQAVLTQMINISSEIVSGAHDTHYPFINEYAEYAEKLKAQAFDFLLLYCLQQGSAPEPHIIKLFLQASDDASFEFLRVLLQQSKLEQLLAYDGLLPFLVKKIARISSISESFMEVFMTEGANFMDANKAHLVFFLLRQLIESRAVFPLSFTEAELLTLFLQDYVDSLEEPASLTSLKMEGVTQIVSSLGVVAKRTIDWLSHSSTTSERTNTLKEVMVRFRNKMKKLRLLFGEAGGEEEKVENQTITAKCRFERRDIEYEQEKIPSSVLQFQADQTYPDLVLKLREHLELGKVLELAVLFIHAGDKMLVEDQTSYKEMVTTIIREADFDGEYRCSLDVLYTLEEDYSEINVKCLECGREAFYGREVLVKENWQCAYCGEENLFRAKYE